MGQFNRFKLSTSGQRHLGHAVSLCMPIDALELVDPAAGTVAELKAAAASVAAIVVIARSGLLAAGLTKLTTGCPARAITFTTAGSAADEQHVSATIVGTGVDGVALTEVVTLADTAATVTSVHCYTDIESITLAAATGTGATLAIGIGNKFAFASKPKVRGAAINVLRETQDGATPTAGAFVVPATSKPYGAYTPNSTPNGALDFVVNYEMDISAFDV